MSRRRAIAAILVLLVPVAALMISLRVAPPGSGESIETRSSSPGAAPEPGPAEPVRGTDARSATEPADTPDDLDTSASGPLLPTR